MSGEQKRANPTCPSRSRSSARCSRPSALPADDLPLFAGIIGDLYPNLDIPAVDYGALKSACEEALSRAGLQVVPRFVVKTIELYQTMNVRFGVMTVGPTGGGKSCCQRALQSAMGALKTASHPDPAMAQDVKTYVFNPKCITMGELYGEFNALTQEWTDGIASTMIRTAVTLTGDSDDSQWVVFDGPVDALWIENMNTVLDDNMTLCLANGERIKLNKKMHMIFEVEDLSVASPATVSRVGIVYLTPENLGWRPYVVSWLHRELWPAQEISGGARLTQQLTEFMMSLFEANIDVALSYVRAGASRELVPTVNSQLIESLCALFISLLPEAKLDLNAEAFDGTKKCTIFYFCLFGRLVRRSTRRTGRLSTRWCATSSARRASFPGGGDVHDYYRPPSRTSRTGRRSCPTLRDPKASFFSMLDADGRHGALRSSERSIDVINPCSSPATRASAIDGDPDA